MQSNRVLRIVRRWLLVLALPSFGIAGCSLLPSDGPNANNVLAGAAEQKKADPAAAVRFALVPIDGRIAAEVERYYQPTSAVVPAAFRRNPAHGMVGVGDLLRITVWEAGGSTGTTLLGQNGKPGGGGTDVVVRVEPDGTIAVPYAERMRASGRTVASLEKAIEASLRGQAVEPRVTILVAEPVSSSVSVQGDAAKPGFVPIVLPQERILDVVAAAGGSKYPPYETGVRLTRGSASVDMGLQTVLEQPDVYNVKVAGGDSLLLTRSVRKFIALGAVTRPGDQVFTKGTLSLSDALGSTMGLNPQTSDAKAVFLFRREPADLTQRCGIALGAGGQEPVPVVYQLDLKDPRGFFILSTFPVRPNDVLYVSTAPLADVGKFMQIVSGATQSVAIPRTLFGGFPSSN